MIYLGKRQKLTVSRETQFGFYLSGPDLPETEGSLPTNEVLLPRVLCPEGFKKGDTAEVFISMDSEDRPVATFDAPPLELGGIARLTVKAVTKIGAFLDWGLAKDLFLPYREQTHTVKEGDSLLVGLYIDKSGRLCATERIYPYLSPDAPYGQGAWVDGLLYEYVPNFGAFVAIDEKYQGLIPKKELAEEPEAGVTIHARVARRLPDGKLELSLKDLVARQMGTDADAIMEKLEGAGGFLPFNDKTAPELIKEEFGMSKNAFKRAIGGLYKERKIEITDKGIRKC
ncbi:MAG: RNA-binding protein [Lachnospiraceae bacterium]|nr:RNA-binding protein [Lachnospiraceae bacterium]